MLLKGSKSITASIQKPVSSIQHQNAKRETSVNKLDPVIQYNRMNTTNSSGATFPKPAITLEGVGIAAGCWLLYATLYSFMVAVSGQDDFGGVYFGQTCFAVILGVLSIAPWWIVVREMEHSPWAAKILVHAVIAPIYAWVSLALFLKLTAYATAPGVYQSLLDVYVFLYGSTVTAYIVQFAVYHAFWIFRRLRQKEKQAAELLALAKESELAALKAQINPHFLFNTLNAISAMVKQDPEETRNMIVQLGDMLRYALDSSQRDLVSLKEELDFARAYLQLESHRLGDRLQVVFDTPAEVDEVGVPPMVLQPLIENAIKHSIALREQGGKVTIRARRSGDSVDIEVEDQGEGGVPKSNGTASTGIGLANTSSRLEKRLGQGAALRTKELQPDGFKVAFSIPFN